MELAGKTVLVTGAAKRIGRALALDLAAAGARIVAHHRDSAAEAASLQGEIVAMGGTCLSLQADLADPLAVQRLADEALAAAGTVHVLINNASVFGRTPLETIDLGAWDRHMAVNVRAPWLLAQALIPAMRAAGSGKIINLTDAMVSRPGKHYLPYQVSKAALNGLTLTLAKELAPEIQVNAVSLGPILPAATMTAAEEQALIRSLPLGRWGTPDDVVAAVRFLLTGTDYATGTTVTVDGGSALR